MRKLEIGRIYKHFKGTRVKVLALALDSETKEKMVVYIRLEDGKIWVRSAKIFLEKVERDGKIFNRFELET